jgi:hypothetical protein
MDKRGSETKSSILEYRHLGGRSTWSVSFVIKPGLIFLVDTDEIHLGKAKF